jgi:hypothetical protein
MSSFEINRPFTRRRALAIGASVAGGFIAATALELPRAFADDSDSDSDDSQLPESVTDEIQKIIQAEGQRSNGVFNIEIDRNDIQGVTLHGVPIKPSFELNGNIVFQARGNGGIAEMNSDMCLKANELNSFITQLLAHNIVFQAEHQHFYDFKPLVWFVHFRAIGDPIAIAKGVKAALNVTSTPFPQTLPSNPTTPLPADQLGDIIGAKPTIGSDGVVSFDLPRRDKIRLGGVIINPYLNVQTNVIFEPYGSDGNAAASPDFSMVSWEVDRVSEVMRKQGWDVGCLYNQETDEQPQLYFSHQFKTGDALDLARQIRHGLNQMNLKFK